VQLKELHPGTEVVFGSKDQPKVGIVQPGRFRKLGSNSYQENENGNYIQVKRLPNLWAVMDRDQWIGLDLSKHTEFIVQHISCASIFMTLQAYKYHLQERERVEAESKLRAAKELKEQIESFQPGIYTHSKTNHDYIVLGIAYDTAHKEPVVIYRSVYAPFECYTRPFWEWDEPVSVRNGARCSAQPRFVLKQRHDDFPGIGFGGSLKVEWSVAKLMKD
jgi:hypothetical protein